MTAHETLPRRTPLYETHRRLGAAMTDFAGWTMPLRYGSETAEHNAVRSAAGLFDLSRRRSAIQSPSPTWTPR
jgi:aminomethyltransferase